MYIAWRNEIKVIYRSNILTYLPGGTSSSPVLEPLTSTPKKLSHNGTINDSFQFTGTKMHRVMKHFSFLFRFTFELREFELKGTESAQRWCGVHILHNRLFTAVKVIENAVGHNSFLCTNDLDISDCTLQIVHPNSSLERFNVAKNVPFFGGGGGRGAYLLTWVCPGRRCQNSWWVWTGSGERRTQVAPFVCLVDGLGQTGDWPRHVYRSAKQNKKWEYYSNARCY